MKLVKLSDGSEIRERRNGNGAARLTWWIMSSAVALVIMGGMAWMTHMSTAIADVQTLSAHRGERLATLESQFIAINTRLTRIEQKVDTLLERKR